MSADLLAGLALFAGPVAGGLLLRSPGLRRALAAFVTVVVYGLVLGHIAPDVVDLAGPWTLAALAAGFAFSFVHHRIHPGQAAGAGHGDHVHGDHEFGAAALVALFALLVHMLLEGVGIASAPAGGDRTVMAVAVAVHRVPIGLALWWMTCPRAGRTGALALLVLGALLTHVGYVGARALAHTDSMALLAWVQAVLSGSLLHVAGAHLPREGQGGAGPAAARVGAGLGGAWVLGTALATHASVFEVAWSGVAVACGALAVELDRR